MLDISELYRKYPGPHEVDITVKLVEAGKVKEYRELAIAFQVAVEGMKTFESARHKALRKLDAAQDKAWDSRGSDLFFRTATLEVEAKNLTSATTQLMNAQAKVKQLKHDMEELCKSCGIETKEGNGS